MIQSGDENGVIPMVDMSGMYEETSTPAPAPTEAPEEG